MMSANLHVTVEDGVGLLEVDSPPVNALAAQVRRSLRDAFAQMEGDPAVQAVVLMCRGRTFFAGADITEFGKPFQEPDLNQLIRQIEGLSKPVVAAMHGHALGGGLEVALGCHYRLAVATAKLGLPEVHLGLLPGAGGTQRLPRLVGVEHALDLITSGRSLSAQAAMDLGIIDELASDNRLREDATRFAQSISAKPLRRVRDLSERVDEARKHPEIFVDFSRKHARAFRGFKAPASIIKAVEASVTRPFEDGLAEEWNLFKALEATTESAAQRHYFFAERDTVRVPDVPSTTPTLPIARVGVIGAGTMGGGIAMNFLNIGMPVTLMDMTEEALERGLGVIRRNYENTVKKGRMTQRDVEQRLALITPTTDIRMLANVDLVIEAVFEEMAVKKDIFSQLDRIVGPSAILASNTSFLNLDEIAAATQRPEQVVGLHFFSPANVMRLLEVVRGARTAPEVIATAMKLGKMIGKVPVLSRVTAGFIANRIMAKRGVQADALVLQGPPPERIDAVMYAYGFSMGPFAMMDLVGLDVIGRGSTERTVAGDLTAMGRLGQKRDGGYYDYDEKRKPTASPVAARVIADVAAARKVQPIGPLNDADIVARLLYPVVNEGAKLLEEGIALRASDIDVAAILGYNWPVYTGGPMFWGDTIGLSKIVETLKELEASYGEAFRPSDLLVEKARKGEALTHG